ncbi:MAG: N-formylglutamate deformylase [Alphaproteobacteria bacterium]|nr:MAG: N-formylglutamate deformylase [Alphaproteobacteria bacterium]
MPAFHFVQGNGPLLVSMPHVGTHLAPEVEMNLSENGRKLTDTDWHLDRLYDFLESIGVSTLMAHHSRTVIDLNRSAEGGVLYPGKSETELCPTTGFDNQPLYKAGREPDRQEILRRKEAYWQPYHDKIRAELDRIRKQYGYALLWDAHSIQSHVPRFFDGRLPDLNLGNGDGVSCAPELAQGLLSIASSSPYSAVLNGRFKGGYITRHYGNPAQDIHAIQLEISQCIYMDEAPDFKFREERAAGLRPTLKSMMDCFLTEQRRKK